MYLAKNTCILPSFALYPEGSPIFMAFVSDSLHLGRSKRDKKLSLSFPHPLPPFLTLLSPLFLSPLPLKPQSHFLRLSNFIFLLPLSHTLTIHSHTYLQISVYINGGKNIMQFFMCLIPPHTYEIWTKTLEHTSEGPWTSDSLVSSKVHLCIPGGGHRTWNQM